MKWSKVKQLVERQVAKSICGRVAVKSASFPALICTRLAGNSFIRASPRASAALTHSSKDSQFSTRGSVGNDSNGLRLSRYIRW